VKKPPKPKAGKPKTKGSTQSKRQLPAEPHIPPHRRLWLAAKVIGSFFVAVIGVIGSVYTVWGPSWPTIPIFSPGPPSYGAAFGVPFQVENKSALFGYFNLKISCKIEGMAKSQIGTGTVGFGENVTFAARGANNLSALSSGPFICPLRGYIKIGEKDAADLMQSAQITFLSEYDRSLWWGTSHSEDGPYTWITTTIPPHWEKGAALR
jgi:hypothetical protein